MKKKIIGGALFLIFGGGIFLFYLLGGFNSILIQTEELGQLELSGVQFRGRPQDESLRAAFQKIEELQKLHPAANIHTIYFDEPAGKMDTMEVFVGLETKWIGNDDGLKKISFDADNAIVATLRAHRFVMPGPLKVKARIGEFAKVQGLQQPDIFIDRIIGPNEVKVIGLIN
jgi:hypothetical protein